MTLTIRTKLLIAAAAAIAGYVAFTQGESEPAEPTKPVTAARTAHAASPTPRKMHAAQSFLRLAHRVVEGHASGSLFAVQSWYVPPPPPPPPPPVAAVPMAPVLPTAPPLPYTYMGSYRPDGAAPVFFLTKGDRVYDVHVGDTLDGAYSVDGFSNGQLVLTYKPLNIQQQLMTGGSQ